MRVLLLGSVDELQGDAATNCERLPGEPPEPFDAGRLEGSAAIVDPASAEAGTVEAAIVPPSIRAATPPATTFFENAFIQLLLSNGG